MITKGVKELCEHAETIIETWTVEQAKEHYGNDDVVFVDIRDIRELWRESSGCRNGTSLVCCRALAFRGISCFREMNRA